MNNMAFARQFGQGAPPGASPWSSGMPPGLQQQTAPQQQQGQPQVPQQMFNQPMGAFDLSGGGGFAQGGPAQLAPVPGQWAQPMQAIQAPVQFVPNSGPFMHQPMQPPHVQQRYHMQQQQRPMHHQRSLSASRVGGVNQNNKRGNNQSNSFGGGQWQPNNRQSNNTNNSNNNDQHSRRSVRQRQQQQQQNQNNNNQQKGQQAKANASSNNNNNNSSNNNNNSSNNKQQNQQKQQQQQQGPKKGPVKVTKAAKKQAVAKANQVSKQQAGDSTGQPDAAKKDVDPNTVTKNQQQQGDKPQSKTAERKQLKQLARKNAESLKLSKMPIVKATKAGDSAANGKSVVDNQTDAADSPIDQAQLKCVPAVFGFVCKACDVFLRDRFARREHIDSESHMEKFKAFEVEQQKLASEKAASVEVKTEPNDGDGVAATTVPATEEDNKDDLTSADVKDTTSTTVGEAKEEIDDVVMVKQESEVKTETGQAAVDA